MSAIQVKAAEVIANEISKKNDKVFAKETPLAQAKAIQGLRAVFDEVCPFFPYQKKNRMPRVFIVHYHYFYLDFIRSTQTRCG